MDVKQKSKFVRELIRNVQVDILAQVAKMPNDWDGHELRRYVADKFEECSLILGRDKYYARRLREYKNTVLVSNL